MVSKRSPIFFLFVFLFLGAVSACGEATSTSGDSIASSPLLTTLTPNAAAIGTTVTIQGTGFSYVTPKNVVIAGGTSITAASYTLINGGGEQLTFTIPTQAQTGAGELIVVVDGESSNALPLTITP